MIVNRTRVGPHTSWSAMIVGKTVGAVAGGPQPARSFGTAGAAAQGAVPDPAGWVGAASMDHRLTSRRRR